MTPHKPGQIYSQYTFSCNYIRVQSVIRMYSRKIYCTWHKCIEMNRNELLYDFQGHNLFRFFVPFSPRYISVASLAEISGYFESRENTFGLFYHFSSIQILQNINNVLQLWQRFPCDLGFSDQLSVRVGSCVLIQPQTSVSSFMAILMSSLFLQDSV